MQPGDSLYPRYCSLCGARFSESEPRCPDCSAAWLQPAANTFYTLALILHDIQARHRDKTIDDDVYLRLVRLYEARLEELRHPAPAAAPAPAPVPAPPPHPAAAIPPKAVPAPAPALAAAQAPAASPALPRPPVPPPPARPAKPPRPPGPSAPRVVFNWAAKRQADLLLYLGAFLMSIAALIFVNWSGSAISGVTRTSILGAYALAFLVLGFSVRRWDRIREAGPVFVGLAALLTPLTFLMLYVRVLDERDVPIAWTWLAGSTTTSGLYFLLVRTGYGRLYAVPATIAALMAWGSLGATIDIGGEWYGAWFAVLAPLANALGTYRYKTYQKWAEVAAVVLVFPSVVFAQGAALLDDVARWQLPITYAFLLAAVIVSVHATRKVRAWALLPVSAAATAGSAAWAATVPSVGEVDWAASWALAAAAGYLVIAHFHPDRARGWAVTAGVAAAVAAVGAHGSCADGDPRALLPVVYGGITAGTVAAWWRWRWQLLVDMVPPAAASFVASTSWAGWDARPETWGELWLAVASAGYLALAMLPRSAETLRRVGFAAGLAAGAVLVAHAAVAEGDNAYRLPATYALVTAGAAALWLRWRWDAVLDSLPVLVAATTSSTTWWALEVSEGSWQQTGLLVASAGYLALAMLPSKEVQARAFAAAAFAGGAIWLSHTLVAEGEERWRLPLSYGFTTAGAALLYARWRWDAALDALPVLVAATTSSTLWWTLDVSEGSWQQTFLLVASGGYLALAMLPSKEVPARAFAAAAFAGGAIWLSHTLVVEGEERWRLPLSYGFTTAGAGLLYARWRWDVALDALPVLVAATTSSTMWWTLDVSEGSWQQTGLLVASAGYLALSMLPSREVQHRAVAAALFAGSAIALSHSLVAEGEERWRLPLAYGFSTAGAGVLWLRWRWDAALDALPVLVAATTSSTMWWTLDVSEGSWQQTGLLVASGGYLSLAMLPSREVQGRAFVAAAFAGGAIWLSHTLVLEGEERWRLPLSYGFTTAGAGVLWLRWRWDAALDALPVLVAATTSSTMWWTLDVSDGSWQQTFLLVASGGYLALVMLPSREVQHRAVAAALFAASAIALSHSLVAEGEDRWRLPLSYGFTTAGAGLLYARWRWDAALDALPVLVAATTSSTLWWTLDVSEASWQQAGLLVASAGYLALAMLPSKEVQERSLAAALFAAAAISLSHGWVAEGEERWRLPLSYGFTFVGASVLYVRWQWPVVLGSLPILGSATLFTSLWAAADIPPEWFTLGPATTGAGYLALAWLDRAREAAWRQMAGVAGIATIAGGHIAAVTPDSSPWQLPATYAAVLAGALWDALPARHERSWLFVPALAGMTGSTALWAGGVPAAHWAWPPVAAGLAIAASELWWRNRPSLAALGWPYALALALVPLGFVGEYVDTPWAGTIAFALAGLAFTWAAARTHGALAARYGLELTPRALLVERQMLGRAGSALFFGAAAYLNLALDLEAAEGAWTYAAIGTAAWLGIAAFARLERSLTGVLVPVAATGLGLALFLARDEYGQSAFMLGAWTAASAVSIAATRRWIAAAPVAAGTAGTLAYTWAARDWPVWSLAVFYAALAIAMAAALTRWRDYGRSERSRVITGLSTLPGGLALAVVLGALNWRSDELARLSPAARPDIATTDEWAAMAGIVVAFGAALFLEGMRLRLRLLAVSGTAAAMLGLEFAIATFQPENVQAYTAPLAIYLMALGMTYRQSSELFGRHMYLHETLIAGGAAVLVLPGAEQALSPGGDRWGLVLIAESFLLLAAGFALSQRWLVVAGVLTIGGIGVRYFSTGQGRLPYWLTLGIAGLILLGFGVLLLSAREWWDRTRLRIGHWWIEGSEEGGGQPPGPPAPRPPRGGAASSPPAAPRR
ncbi:MAG: hypothetical protein HY875_09205 [Chloroflexi bacterium]|nr:hypothetical protein [Chloroflexota bacterium]